MKTLRNILGAVVVVVLVLAPGMIGGTIQTHYHQVGVVTAINGDEVTVMDNRGELWVYSTNKEFALCDKVKLTMFTNYTDDTIYDDVIVKIKKF